MLIDGLHARRRIKVEAHSPASRDGVGFRFIAIADSHIRQPDQESDAYPSNAWLVQRNKFIVDLPRGSESSTFDDDEGIGDRVATAALVASSEPDVAVFPDGFMDHDRGYYPRNGLIDRSFNPRAALYRLIEVSSGRG